jgi:hypothetical protein
MADMPSEIDLDGGDLSLGKSEILYVANGKSCRTAIAEDSGEQR